MVDYALLEKLCLANAISGDEESVRDIVVSEIRDYADEIRIDNLGNILVHKRGRNPAVNRLMLSAHLDEVGLMVTDITSDGYLKFDMVGGIDRRVLIGKRVSVGKNKLHGVIGIKPVHLTHGDEDMTIPELSEMYIDVGAKSTEDALQYINYGDSVYFVSEFTQTEKKICSKAIDDRFGCLVLISLIKSELEYDMDFAFVVQEEVGLRGAKAAAYSVNPDFALVFEATTAADTPESETDRKVCRLGDGAVISLMDRHTIYDKRLISAAFELAEKNGVKVQYKKAVAGGNDAGVIHQSRSGVRTLAISLATRYLHSPSCVADKDDCESVISLAFAFADQIAGGMIS